MTILLAGGGSGGHILPNIALYQELKKVSPTTHVVYFGEKGGMEEQMAKDAGMVFYGIHAGKMRRYFSLQNMVDWFKIPLGCIEALLQMQKVSPRVIFTKGGYVSFPVVVAGWLLRIPVIIHESDVEPGLTTRLCARFASTICVSWQKTRDFFSATKQVVVTGVPIRSALLEGNAMRGRLSLDIQDHDKLPLIMVMGGSLGATDLNNYMLEHLPELLQTYHVYHLTGAGKSLKPKIDLDHLPGSYTQQEFGDQTFADRMAAADIIISRAGTTALAEYAALGKRVILVPLPSDRSRGDQEVNAQSFQTDFPDQTIILEQKDFTESNLSALIQELLQKPLQKKAASQATQLILDLLLKKS